MNETAVEFLVFVACALVGGALLLTTVLVDDFIGSLANRDIGGVSLLLLLGAFVSMFGVGGLFASQVLDVHGGQAAIAGSGFGVVGIGVAYRLSGLPRHAEIAEPFAIRELIGDDAFVAVGILAGRPGSVVVNSRGQRHELRATASTDVRAGTTVRVIGVTGAWLVVEALPPVNTERP